MCVYYCQLCVYIILDNIKYTIGIFNEVTDYAIVSFAYIAYCI